MVPGDSVAIDGVIRLDNAIEAETIGSVIRLGQNPIIELLEVTENGTYEVPDGVRGFNPVRVALPEYEGDYTVEPSTEEQTLATAGKVMMRDVTVGKIEPVSWKTIKLDEPYERNGLDSFMSFLGIEKGDVRDGYNYLVFVNGNTDTSVYALKVEIIGIFDGHPDGVRGLTIRGDYSRLTFGNASNVARNISAGAVVKIYRFKR
jgi:hypothetical protein